MDATTTRPTAWAVLYDNLDPVSPIDLDRALDALAEHGYVVVHPDDVSQGRMPVVPGRVYTHTPGTPTYEDGWNACRAHVFGDA